MSSVSFQRATREQAKLRLGLFGPPKSGKTYTSLAIATALGGPIALVDTEHHSASKYASGKPFEFDHLLLTSYHPQNYIEAIQAAEEGGYGSLIIDSLSHAWVGKDGELEIKDKASQRPGENSFTSWRYVTPLHNAMVDAILAARLHVIATMRVKTEYVIERNERGQSVPRKVGLAPVMRDGIEYEFDICGDMTVEHAMVVSGSRCSALDGQTIQRPGAQVAKVLLEWLGEGEPPPPLVSAETAAAIDAEIVALFDGNDEVARRRMEADYGTRVTARLTVEQATELAMRLDAKKAELKGAAA